jgi:hypothetical protein
VSRLRWALRDGQAQLDRTPRLLEEVGVSGSDEDETADVPGRRSVSDRVFGQRRRPRLEGIGVVLVGRLPW